MLHDITGSEHKVVHDYKVSGWGCRISRVRQTRSGWCFRISRIRNNSSNMHTRYHNGAAGSHGEETSDRTCLRSIRVGLEALTGKEQQFQHAYEVSGQGCRISRVGNIGSNMPTIYQVGAAGSHGLGTTDRTDSIYLHGIRSGLLDLTGKAHQIESAYTVSGRGCRISRVGYYRSYMPTRHQEGTRISRVRNTDRTCLLPVVVRTALHDLTDSEHKIVHAYNVSGRSCRISQVGNYRSYMPTRHQEGTSGSHGFETQIERAY